MIFLDKAILYLTQNIEKPREIIEEELEFVIKQSILNYLVNEKGIDVNELSDLNVRLVIDFEDDLTNKVENDYVKKVREFAASHESEVVTFSAKVEAELIEIEDEEERQMFIDELGITEPSLNRLIRGGFKLLGLITYFTAGEKEVRAWTVKQGTNAQKSAGEIHTDIEKGFIRAEVVAYEKFIEYNGWQGSKEKGAMRLEGKEYIVNDGDVMYFRFNV